MLVLRYPHASSPHELTVPGSLQTIVYFSGDQHHDATYVEHNHRRLYAYLRWQLKELGLKPCSRLLWHDFVKISYTQLLEYIWTLSKFTSRSRVPCARVRAHPCGHARSHRY